jgi:hypothetical protein
MKKLMLMAALCVAALAVIPISSASAYAGACEIQGKADFKPTKLEASPGLVDYSFASSKVSCQPAGGPTAVEVTGGEVEAGCITPVLPEGAAALANVNDGTVYTDSDGDITAHEEEAGKLDIAGSAAGIVNTKLETLGVVSEDVPKAVGPAEFFTSGILPEEGQSASTCFTSSVTNLGFVAVLAGTF